MAQEGFSWRRKQVSEEIVPEHHFANLHDLDEDVAGEKLDPATGKAINNSGDVETADTKVHAFHRRLRGSQDVLGALPPEADKRNKKADQAAEDWLRQNDPDHPGYRKAA
jgi:hypothetical protein